MFTKHYTINNKNKHNNNDLSTTHSNPPLTDRAKEHCEIENVQ